MARGQTLSGKVSAAGGKAGAGWGKVPTRTPLGVGFPARRTPGRWPVSAKGLASCSGLSRPFDDLAQVGLDFFSAFHFRRIEDLGTYDTKI